MRHRRRRIDRAPPVEPEPRPAPVALFPVHRRDDAFRLHPGPAIGEPVARLAIAAIGNERRPFAIGHRPVGDRVTREQRVVPRRLAIEREAVAVMPHPRDPGVAFDPADRARHLDRHLARRGPDRGLERIFRKQMEDVGHQQFLVLLLVMTAQRHQLARRLGQVGQRRDQRRIDMRAVRPHLVERRPRDHPAPVARMPPAFRLVIAVEQERKALVVQPVPRDMIAQHERLEEPAGMRQMPFGRRCVGHRLHRRIRIRQRRGQRDRQVAHGCKAGTERVRVRQGCRIMGGDGVRHRLSSCGRCTRHGPL